MRVYKLIIVEDEKPTREELAAYDWAKFDVELAGQYTNGLEAYAAISESSVDIVLTDIKMPLMDGIKLVKAIKTDYPSTLCVVLSGYSEFEYLHTAIQWNVSDYLLKPVDYAEIDKVFERLVHQLEVQRENQQREDILLSRLKKGIHALRKDFFKELFTSAMTEDAIREKSEYCEMLLFDNDFSLAVYRFDHERNPADSHSAQWNLRLLGLQKSFDDYLLQDELGYAWVDRATHDCVVIITDAQAQADRNVLETHLSQLKKSAYAMRGLTFDTMTCLAYHRLSDPCRIYQCVENAKNNFSRYAMNDAVYFLEQSAVADLPKPAAEGFTASVKNSEVSGHQQANINKILQYIQENYAKPITLNQLANAVYMNPVYVSQLFKKGVGINFIDYLIHYRIEKAKEMLLHSEKQVYQIGLSVGYSNPGYFCQVFKRVVGLSPVEYRNKYIQI